jgi:hypothetical protein
MIFPERAGSVRSVPRSRVPGQLAGAVRVEPVHFVDDAHRGAGGGVGGGEQLPGRLELAVLRGPPGLSVEDDPA